MTDDKEKPQAGEGQDTPGEADRRSGDERRAKQELFNSGDEKIHDRRKGRERRSGEENAKDENGEW